MRHADIFYHTTIPNRATTQAISWVNIIFLMLFGILLSPHNSAAEPLSTIPETSFAFESEHEKRLGTAMMRQLRSTERINTDLIYSEYVRSLGNRLVAAAQTPFQFHFFVVETPVVNAFAFFGGHVGVDTGLLQTVENEDELAAVLAHEIAHVSQQHLARVFKANQQLLPVTMIQLLSALAIGSMTEPGAGAHMVTAVMAGHQQKLINYTRAHEQEADRIGIHILANAGFDPEAMPALFNRLSTTTRHQDKPSPYLLTHPLYESRIADAYHRIKQFSYRQHSNSDLFNWIKIRLQVMHHPEPAKLAEQFAKRIQSSKPPQSYLFEYGYALALKATHAEKQSYQLLQKISSQIPNNWVVCLELAQLEIHLGKRETALQRLQLLTDRYAGNRAILFQYIELLIDLKQSKVAKTILMSKSDWATDYPIWYELLAKTYYLLNKRSDVHHMQAEWYLANGDYKGALQQLDIALKHAPSTQVHLLTTRKKEIEQLQRDEQSLL